VRLDLAGVLLPIAVAGVVVYAAPMVTRRAPWPALLVLVAVAALAWDLSLTVVDGPLEIERPLRIYTQYILAVPAVDSPGAFLSTFVERIDDYRAHVRSHPPAMLLGLWGLEQIGLGGTWAAAIIILLIAVTTGPAVLIALRRLAGEAAARRAAPYLVLSVAALSIATTHDALYMAVGAWGITALILAIDGRGLRSDLLAAIGGLLLAIAIFCSYGLVLLAMIPLAVAAARRRVRPLVVAAIPVGLVVGGFAAAGFWWVDGFFATRREYYETIASTRPYEYFLLNNGSAFAVWLGPAIALALARLRDRATWLLVGGALAAVALADLSGMSKAEVERIWLPFLPWVLLATAALPASPAATRWLLTGQAALALAVAFTVNSLW